MTIQKKMNLRALLKIVYRLTTLIATLAGRDFKAKGFSFYLRGELDRQRAVLVRLYQKRLGARYSERRQEHDPVLEEYLRDFNALDGVLKGKPIPKRIAFEGIRKIIGQNTCTHPHISMEIGYYFDGCTGQGFSHCPDCGRNIYQGHVDQVRMHGPMHLPLDPSQPIPIGQKVKREVNK